MQHYLTLFMIVEHYLALFTTTSTVISTSLPVFFVLIRDYFCIDGLKYHGAFLTVIWDKSGLRYGHGKGFHVLINGVKAASATRPRKLKIKLSQFL